MPTRFEWDAAKASSNFSKHGITFETALRVFADPYSQSKRDRFENGEERWQTIGAIDGRLIVVVAHTLREEHEDGTTIEVIRIISARRADPKEKRRYGR